MKSIDKAAKLIIAFYSIDYGVYPSGLNPTFFFLYEVAHASFTYQC